MITLEFYSTSLQKEMLGLLAFQCLNDESNTHDVIHSVTNSAIVSFLNVKGQDLIVVNTPLSSGYSNLDRVYIVQLLNRFFTVLF